MNYSWSKTVFPIAAIFSFRMLGLFLLIPIFSIYANDLKDATPTLIGFALGGYGLTQGVLQMPFGMLSDKIGRKPVIAIGLILFTFGSLLGAMTHSIYGMIISRVLQGTGAIGSVLIALLADLTLDHQRTKAMAVIGMTIGISFSISMVISPIIATQFGLSGIFYLTAILATLGLALLLFVIPNPQKEHFHVDSEANPALLRLVIKNKHLQRLNFGIFCQHFILTSTFFALPMIIKNQISVGNLAHQWHFYFYLMVFSFVLMIPFIILAEKKKRLKLVFILAIASTAATQLILTFAFKNWAGLCCLMFIYFVAFNILEALLPSLVSKQAHPNSKGTAMGIYSTSQFLGLFMGGSLSGVIYQWHGIESIFIVNAILSSIWFVISCSLQPNAFARTLILSIKNSNKTKEDLFNQLSNLKGIIDLAVSDEEHVVYLRVDNERYIQGSAERCI